MNRNKCDQRVPYYLIYMYYACHKLASLFSLSNKKECSMYKGLDTPKISETLFKLITHCFGCLLRCVEFSRSLTMFIHTLMLPDSASFIMLQLHM